VRLTAAAGHESQQMQVLQNGFSIGQHTQLLFNLHKSISMMWLVRAL
jgi:hypothetical protein